MRAPDAIVVGSGPNGLAAAITLAQAGCAVQVFEAEPAAGGGVRSAELTLPGFLHDVCSAVHPLAAASPFLRTLPLGKYGLEWVHPPVALAHPFDDGTAAALGPDGRAYEKTLGRVAREWELLEDTVLAPPRLPHHPLALARFGLRAVRPAAGFARATFSGEHGRALFAGIAAHGMVPLERPLTAAFGLVLGGLAYVAGWPFARGGSQRIADAMVAYLRSLGGEVVTGAAVRSLDELPRAKAVLCDLSPRPLLAIAGERFPARYRRRLERYRYGPGVFKVDWALDAPVPWRAAECARAGTVHIGGTLEAIAAAEREVWAGRAPERPFVLLAQPSLFDPTRAPAGKHTAWAYCHVPNGSRADMLPRIEAQIERFAPGFRERVLARHVAPPAQIEKHNANLVGGDIAAGVQDWRGLLTRPAYATPVRGLYICSASTAPGAGVHGLCGWYAAQRALERM